MGMGVAGIIYTFAQFSSAGNDIDARLPVI